MRGLREEEMEKEEEEEVVVVVYEEGNRGMGAWGNDKLGLFT